MIAAWGSESDDEHIDETALMAIRDSYIEGEEATSEISILDLKEKLYLFSKRKLFSLTSILIDDFQELTYDKNELFTGLASLKFDYIGQKIFKIVIEKENSILKKSISKLDSSNMNIKSKTAN